MNQLMERMCSLSNCCVSSRDRQQSDQGPLFERRLREQNRRGVNAALRTHPSDHSKTIYSDYDFDSSHQSQEPTPRQDDQDLRSTHAVTAMFPFEGTDPQPFPPDPFPDLSLKAGDKLRLFPSMTQYGWCFVVDVRDDARRGWVPGNYITSNGREPYMRTGGQLEESLWSEVRSGGGVEIFESQEVPETGNVGGDVEKIEVTKE